MNGNKTDSPLVLLFVEGDTDMVFFNALLRYYRSESKSPMNAFQVVNLQSVTRYAGKMINKLQNDIIPTAVTKGRSVKAVCCSYDTDVFDNGIQVVNWKMLEKRVRRLGIADFFRIGVKSMIEDWLLDDIEGLCSYLKLKQIPVSLYGKTGYDKLVSLFARAGYKYSKGFSVSAFIGCLDMSKIREKHKDTLRELELALNATMV